MQKFVQKSYITIYIVITNRKQYVRNANIHGRNTRYDSDIHQTIPDLSLYQRGSYHMRRKVFNSLPTYIKDISFNVKEFMLLLK
jgi:hypothetical protein